MTGSQEHEHGRADADAADDSDALWAQCQQFLRATVSSALWHGYLKPLRPLYISEETAVLLAPDAAVRDRVLRRCIPVLLTAFTQLPVSPRTIEIDLDPEIAAQEHAQDMHDGGYRDSDDDVTPASMHSDLQAADRTGDGSWPDGPQPADAPGSARRAKTSSPAADRAYALTDEPASAAMARTQFKTPETKSGADTFENFVTGSGNRFAHAAALSVAEHPGESWNPLFIHGDTGLGKTHLLHAIVNYLTTTTDCKVRYASTETFLAEFIEAIRTTSTTEFKRRYRKLDVLLLDDIQFMQGKEGLQEEFFHTFNSLHDAGKQIVLSSDRSPRNIATLSDRLRSRFEGGLTTDIQPPDLETRVAILHKKTEGKQVPNDVITYVAELVTNNIRSLEGALVRIVAYASLNRLAITLDLAQTALGDMSASMEQIITPQRIMSVTTDMFGYEPDELASPKRHRDLVRARQISMYVMRELTELSYPAIGKLFGGRDHTTVMHAVKKIEQEMPSHQAVYDQVTALLARLKAA